MHIRECQLQNFSERFPASYSSSLSILFMISLECHLSMKIQSLEKKFLSNFHPKTLGAFSSQFNIQTMPKLMPARSWSCMIKGVFLLLKCPGVSHTQHTYSMYFLRICSVPCAYCCCRIWAILEETMQSIIC